MIAPRLGGGRKVRAPQSRILCLPAVRQENIVLYIVICIGRKVPQKLYRPAPERSEWYRARVKK